MKLKLIIFALALAITGVGGFFGLKAWRASVILRQEQRAFAVATSLVAKEDYQSAITVIRQQPVISPKLNLNWPALEVRALGGLRAVPQLAGIFQRTPNRVLADEEASLILARAFLASHNNEGYGKIRKAWTGREIHQDWWLILDSDVFLVANKSREAERVLNSRKFTGKPEASRLERLAILVASRDLPQAWQYLSDATKIDPRNPELRSFRAQILEGAGKPEAASIEYLAAAAAGTNNPVLADQLAEFYRRQGNYDGALDSWEHALAKPAIDYLAVKAAFWQRMIRPGKLDAAQIPAGELAALARWISELPATDFFDTNTFAALPQAQRFERQQQEVFWLQVASLARHRRDAEVADLLRFNPFRENSWEPDLQVALSRISYYRLKHSLKPPGLSPVARVGITNRHEFFNQLEALAANEHGTNRVALPADMDALLRGPDAYAAAFLAANWREAALRLCDPSQIPAGEPTWFAFGLAQILRMNRSPAAALEFLNRQHPEPMLQLLTGELKIETGQTSAGLADLAHLAPLNSAIGFRASYLLALACVEQKHLEDATKWVRQNPLLSVDPMGREVLAQVALQTGRTNEAEQIYSSIATQSVMARAFLAKLAFTRQNWTEARRLTTELLQLVPEDLQYRANLAAIDRAQAAGPAKTK